MKDSLKEPKLTYALDSSEKMVHVSSVERGLSCNCRCPKCKEPLEAKLGYGGRQPHFAHKKDSDCQGFYMTALHKLAEQIIEEEKAVMAPAYKEIGRGKLSFSQVEVEQRVERKDLQPDLVGITEDGSRWIIEIRNTHEVDEAKRAKLIESNITCLEIDVREQTLENLKSFILESSENREWINNPNYDAQIVEAKRKRVSKVEKYLLSCTELTIPAYVVYASRKISISERFVLSKTADKLFSQVKVLSSDGTTYVFNIGSRDILGNNIKEYGGDCNELIIVTDSISLEGDINSRDFEMSWSYHLATEKKQEKRVKEYRNNPKYEVKPSSDCIFECRYRPFRGDCIYKMDIVTLEGINYVVCNKGKRLMDEYEYQPHHHNRDDSFVSVKSSHDIKKDNLGVDFVRQQIIKKDIEMPQNGNLPFEKFWTIEDYYLYLTSSNSHETEKGCFAEIVKCDIVCNILLLLYKDPVEVRTFTPYHIAVIITENGNLIQNEVAVFSNKNSAMNSYCGRLSLLRNSI